MNLQFTKEELDFQKEVRDWIKDNYPEDMKDRLMNSLMAMLLKKSMLNGSKRFILKVGLV